jgi:hypothetical protein
VCERECVCVRACVCACVRACVCVCVLHLRLNGETVMKNACNYGTTSVLCRRASGNPDPRIKDIASATIASGHNLNVCTISDSQIHTVVLSFSRPFSYLIFLIIVHQMSI